MKGDQQSQPGMFTGVKIISLRLTILNFNYSDQPDPLLSARDFHSVFNERGTQSP